LAEPRRLAVGEVTNTEIEQKLSRTITRRAMGRACEFQHNGNVVNRGKGFDESESLEHESHVPGAKSLKFLESV
jgi:hypothetical protein